jgi:two-component system CheB/CheR fusion protein
VVNEEHEIVHLSETAGRYLQVAGGEPSQNLLKLVRQELRLELRSILYQAVQRHTAVESRPIPITIDERPELVVLHVRPVFQQINPVQGYLLVLFATSSEEIQQHPPASADEPVAMQLEKELMHVKTQLRASNEQHDFHAEELKASNEELQAINEELRSAAEELETSKEELQSINEELRTVNQELKIKIEETTLANNNLQNLIISVNIGTIFLDRSLRVVLFTPAATKIFNLIAADYGRPLSDITHHLQYGSLIEDAETVLEKLQVLEREAVTNTGAVYLMRLLPYRTAEDHINGVVITFVDITERKKTEEYLRKSEERLRLILESAADFAIIALDEKGNIQEWSTGAERIFGYDEAEVLGKPGSIIFTKEDKAAGVVEAEQAQARNDGRALDERWHVRKDGSRVFMSGVMAPMLKNALNGYVKVARDMTARKAAEETLRLAEERQRIALAIR